MVTTYEETEKIELSDAEEAAIIGELEDTFSEISEFEENEFISQLPQKTKESYQEIVNTSAEKAMKKTYMVLLVFIGIALLLSFFLPSIKLE